MTTLIVKDLDDVGIAALATLIALAGHDCRIITVEEHLNIQLKDLSTRVQLRELNIKPSKMAHLERGVIPPNKYRLKHQR